MNGEQTTNEEKMKFYQPSTKYTKYFLLYNQINKIFGDKSISYTIILLEQQVFLKLKKSKNI